MLTKHFESCQEQKDNNNSVFPKIIPTFVWLLKPKTNQT